ncbi:MAG TPA: phosphotransferase, partial [Thermoanaerobaculia bacterium]|nr:phosphotransferase [Thermoanaerobaculia bacterium]
MIGTALATCHRALSDRVRFDDTQARAPFPARIPQMLQIDRLDVFAASGQSDGQALLLLAAQGNETLTRGIARLRDAWQVNSLVHGDMKWHNCVASGEGLFLVDWESADLGDAAWDVAGILQSYLAQWIWVAGAGPELSSDAAAVLDALHDSVALFWSAYVSSLPLPLPARPAFLERAVALAAARLLQTAYEALRDAKAMTPLTVRLLQAAINVLDDTAAAGRELFGLDA